MTIKLTKGFEAQVDDDLHDYLSQWKWHYNDGYADRKENGKHIRMHRAVMNTNKMIDHKNGNSLDNRKENLRIANHSTNAMNMRKHKGKSVFKGVSKEGNKWRTQVFYNNQRVFSAYFKTERQAGLAYDLNAPILFGEFARLNFEPVVKTADGLQ